ncbi:MAG: polyprenyl diphosphate synthase [Actinomycetota bacterium]
MTKPDPAIEAQVARLEGATVPKHLAVIPDGNRRWAMNLNKSVVAGHRAGFEVAKRLSRFCRRIGIHTTTVWAFSTENWRRSSDQVSALMELYLEWIRDLTPEAIKEEVRVVHLGRLEGVPDEAKAAAEAAGHPDGLPSRLRDAIRQIETDTAAYDKNVINLAINYGGADEVQRAVQKLVARAAAIGKDPADLDILHFLDTAGQPHPNPDILWRTSGEFRSSGFLPLQAAYAEMIFTPKLFPDLAEADVVEAVEEYSARKRRFGG